MSRTGVADRSIRRIRKGNDKKRNTRSTCPSWMKRTEWLPAAHRCCCSSWIFLFHSTNGIKTSFSFRKSSFSFFFTFPSAPFLPMTSLSTKDVALPTATPFSPTRPSSPLHHTKRGNSSPYIYYTRGKKRFDSI